MLTPGTLLGERYEIIEKIGAGGMSIVYKAKDNRLQRFVAIKELREEFVKDEEFVAKFRKEALSAASLSHPNVVGIYDVGNDHDIHYIVMEYVEGKTLKELIAQEGPFEASKVLDLGIQMVSALKHAHSKKIIHRDIKPQNILLTNEGVLKVTDFGIAKAVDSSTIVATSNAIGSVHYFSPEQAKGKYVNESSDLYSCGIVLFELATQKLPFEADSHISIALKHINEEIPRPSTINPNIPSNLEQLILKATSKGQLDRYQNADEMLYDMRSMLKNPAYVIPTHAITEETILLSAADTQLLRDHYKTEPEVVVQETQEEIPSIYEEETEGLEEEEEEDVSTLYKWLVGAAGVLATLAIVVVVALAVFVGIPSMTKVKMIVVPDVMGQTVEQARALLKERGLKLEIKEGDEAGIIIEQNPIASTQVKKNTVIEVTVGEETPAAEEMTSELIKLPNLRGYEQTDALNRLRELGFVNVTLDPQYDEEVKMGDVVSQSPTGDSMISKEDAITLIISRGPEERVKMTTVPYLTGKTVAEASSALQSNGLILGGQTTDYSDTVPEGLIMNQSVAGGSTIEEGKSIDVVVSQGPKLPEEEPEMQPQPGEEEPNMPEEPPEPEVPAEVETTYSINLPSGIEAKESYHVMAVLKLPGGTRSVYDEVILSDQFPKVITLKGSGQGKIEVVFDGNSRYEEDVYFNEEQ